LLQEADDRRRQFQAMLRESESEADRDGTLSVESVLAEADRIIDKTSR
jgi:antitoxin ParD1/3/4